MQDPLNLAKAIHGGFFSVSWCILFTGVVSVAFVNGVANVCIGVFDVPGERSPSDLFVHRLVHPWEASPKHSKLA